MEEAGRVAERPISVQGELEEVLAQEDDLLRAREDSRSVREPGLQGVLPQEPISPGVEGADHRVRVAIGHQLVDALGHLQRGPIGEGERQDL